MDLAIQILTAAQNRVLARLDVDKQRDAAKQFAYVRSNLNHYRNLCSLRELLAPRRH